MPNAVQLSAYGITEGGGIVCYNYLSDTLEQIDNGAHASLHFLQARLELGPDTYALRSMLDAKPAPKRSVSTTSGSSSSLKG